MTDPKRSTTWRAEGRSGALAKLLYTASRPTCAVLMGPVDATELVDDWPRMYADTDWSCIQ